MARASIPQHLLGGGTKPEKLGSGATSVGDRNVAARDTTYRRPPARSDTTASTKKAAPSGGKKAGGGDKKTGGFRLPKRAPTPTPRPDPNLTLGGTPTTGYGSPSTFPARPAEIPRQMPQQLPGLPIELQDQTAMPNPALASVPPVLGTPQAGGTPTAGYEPQPFPMRPGMVSDNTPVSPLSPTNVPSPGRDEMAALLAQKSMLPGEDAMNQWGRRNLPQRMPGEDAMNQWGKQHLPWWLGGGG